MRSVAERRFGRVIIHRVVAAVNVKRTVLVGETVVHFVVVMDLMVIDVLVTGRNRDRVAVLVRHRFTVPDRSIMFY